MIWRKGNSDTGITAMRFIILYLAAMAVVVTLVLLHYPDDLTRPPYRQPGSSGAR